MNSDELKSLQAPLKERYKAEPGAALITLRATGHASEGVSCKVETGRALVTAGLHPATGGDGSLACSGDMLDFRGTLGVAKDARVGFGTIRLNFALDTDASADQIATLLKLTERYCVVYQTLRQPPEILVRLKPDTTSDATSRA